MPIHLTLMLAHLCTGAGDNMLTAVSVARQCGLVPADDRLVLVNAYPPDTAAGTPARIDWLSHDDATHHHQQQQADLPTPYQVMPAFKVLGYVHHAS